MRPHLDLFFTGEGLSTTIKVVNGVPLVKFEQGYTTPLSLYMDLAQIKMLGATCDRFVAEAEAKKEVEACQEK